MSKILFYSKKDKWDKLDKPYIFKIQKLYIFILIFIYKKMVNNRGCGFKILITSSKNTNKIDYAEESYLFFHS